MKVIWLILLYIISLININLADDNDSLETKLIPHNSTITTKGSVTDKKEITLNKHKNFIVTRKPPINYHHKKLKGKYIKSKHKNSKYSTEPKTGRNRSKIHKRKHKFATKSKENIKKIFQDKIVKPNISDESEAEEDKAIVCKGLHIKKLLDKTDDATRKGKSYTNKHSLRNYELNDTSVTKLRKCLTKLKKLKISSSSEEDTKRKKDKIDHKTLNALERLLENMNKSVTGAKINNITKTEDHKGKVTVTTDKPTDSGFSLNKDDTSAVSRSKRSVNIIEEESVATTSAGFSFTGRDLSINHQFTYRNIHY